MTDILKPAELSGELVRFAYRFVRRQSEGEWDDAMIAGDAERLIRELTPILQPLLTRIEALEAERDRFMDLYDAARGDVVALELQHERTRDALEPFAATARVLGDTKDSAIWAGQRPAPPLTFGDFRKALAALSQGTAGSSGAGE